MACVATLKFSPEQGQSAARVEGPDTAVLEQGFELGMKETEVTRWAKGLDRARIGTAGTLVGLSPGDSRSSLWC